MIDNGSMERKELAQMSDPNTYMGRTPRIRKNIVKGISAVYKLKNKKKDAKIEKLHTDLEVLEAELMVMRQNNKFLELEKNEIKRRFIFSMNNIEPYFHEIEALKVKNSDLQGVIADLSQKVNQLNDSIASKDIENRVKDDMIAAQKAYVSFLLEKTTDCNLKCQTDANNLSELLEAKAFGNDIGLSTNSLLSNITKQQKDMENQMAGRITEVRNLKAECMIKDSRLKEQEGKILALESNLHAANEKYEQVTEAVFIFNQTKSRVHLDEYLSKIREKFMKQLEEKNEELKQMKKHLEIYSLKETVRQNIYDKLKSNIAKVLTENMGLRQMLSDHDPCHSNKTQTANGDRMDIDSRLSKWLHDINVMISNYGAEDKIHDELKAHIATLHDEINILRHKDMELAEKLAKTENTLNDKEKTIQVQNLTIDELNKLINNQQLKIHENERNLAREKLRASMEQVEGLDKGQKPVLLDFSEDADRIKFSINAIKAAAKKYIDDFKNKAEIGLVDTKSLIKSQQVHELPGVPGSLHDLMGEIESIVKTLAVDKEEILDQNIEYIDKTNLFYHNNIKAPELRMRVLENELKTMNEANALRAIKNYIIEEIKMPKFNNVIVETEELKEIFDVAELETKNFMDSDGYVRNDKVTNLLKIATIYLRTIRTRIDEIIS